MIKISIIGFILLIAGSLITSCNNNPAPKNINDVSDSMKKVDMMHKDVVDRLTKVDEFCKENHVEDSKRRFLLQETNRIGIEEQRRVQQSGYKLSFNPKYPELKK